MGKISKKFNWLLILSVSLSVFISSFATTTYLIYLSEKNTHDKNIIQTKGLANYIHEYLNNAYILNYQLSINPVIANMVKSADENWERRVEKYNRNYNTEIFLGNGSGPPLLVTIHKRYGFIDLLYVQDTDGNQTGRSFGNIGKRSARWWYKEFMENHNRHPFISKSYYSLTGNKPVASIFHPVLDGGSVIGIMGMDIDFTALQKAVETYLNTADMYAVVVDNRGVIIAHPDREIIREIYNLSNLTKRILKRDSSGNVISDENGNQITETAAINWDPEIKKAVNMALSGNDGYLRNVTMNNVQCTVYYEPVPLPSENGIENENYGVLIIQEKTAIVKAQNIILFSTALLILIVIAALYNIFHSRFKKFILQPLQVLIDSMNNVDIDNFQTIKLDTNDEFSLMAKTYNDLRINLAKANRQLLEKIEMLKEREEGYRTLSEIGLALTTENNLDKLLELILKEAMRFTRSDGGTLYVYDREKKHLNFEILYNETMNLQMGGSSDIGIDFPPVPLYVNGKPNYSNVSSYSALTGEVVNIPDVYKAEGFDFSGTRKYDSHNNYLSKSMLVIPMMNKDKHLIGVLQLINAREKDSDKIIPYSEVYSNLIATLAYQAAVKMTNVQLNIRLKELLYSVIKSIASAIDEKSPFTGKHISNVYQLTMMIAEKINKTGEGHFKNIAFSEDELEELKLSAWMHDIGKITTPESLLNKGTKLETVLDRIELIRIRFQFIKEILQNRNPLDKKTIDELEDDLEFIIECNNPGIDMTEAKQNRLRAISEKTITVSDTTIPYLTDEELENLSICRGTLNKKEREIIEDHVRVTQKILEHISFPDHVSKVPEYASMHHEKLDGTGYHRGLKGDEIPLQARIIAVADIFEALTAKERPYKDSMNPKEVLKVLDKMGRNNFIDHEILKLIIEYGIVDEYMKGIMDSDAD